MIYEKQNPTSLDEMGSEFNPWQPRLKVIPWSAFGIFEEGLGLLLQGDRSGFCSVYQQVS